MPPPTSVAACAVQARLNADTSDQTAPRVVCACGQAARYAGRRAKTFANVLGPLTLERAYYHCAACAAGFCPRDRALGLVDTSLSPGVLRMVGLVGALVSFEEGHELLRELAGVRVPTTHVERAAEALGREIAHDERTVVEPPPAGEPVAPTLYLGLDGTGVPIRKEDLADRAGKQPDGTAKTREVKLCTLWSAEGRDPESTPMRDAGSVSYSAAIESAAQRDTADQPSAFAARVVREVTRRRFERAVRRVVLGTAPRGSGTSRTNTCPRRSRSWTGSTSSSTSPTWPSPSTERPVIWRNRGSAPATTSWMPAISTPSSRPLRARAARRRGAQVCRLRRTQPRAHGRLPGVPGGRAVHLSTGVVAGCTGRLARGVSARAWIGPWPGPTRSSPCAAAS